jgi:hypothetical protein
MKDAYENAKNAARLQMMREADAGKAALIREIKQGLGEQVVEKLEKAKPPSRRKIWWNKIKKVLGL